MAVAGVIAITNVEDSAVAELLHEALRDCSNSRICSANPQTRISGVSRTLPQLLPGEADQTFGVFVKVAVEHPDAVSFARNKLLQHQVRLSWLLVTVIVLQQFTRGAHDEHLFAGAFEKPRAVAGL